MLKYSFAFLDKFKKDYKDAKKKNPTLDTDFEEFLNMFNPTKGDTVAGTNGAQKIRMPRANKGKSGGYRVYYFFLVGEKIYLLRLFAKSEQDELSIKEKIQMAEIIKAIQRNDDES